MFVKNRARVLSSTTPPATTVLRAIRELVLIAHVGKGRGIDLRAQPVGTTGATGRPLEVFAKNMFAECLGAPGSQVDAEWQRTFCWTGSDNNPPDFMVRNGDAVEVKQLGGIGDIQLNSSPPKRVLRAEDPRLTEACRTCEEWTQRDFWYLVGKVNPNYVEALWIVDGKCLADKAEKYDMVFSSITGAVSELGGTPSQELGRINELDSLGSTSLRVRGMWLLKHPAKVFADYLLAPHVHQFVLNVLISSEKWKSFGESEIRQIVDLEQYGLMTKEIQIPDAINKGGLQSANHISWSVNIQPQLPGVETNPEI
ncbi:MAG: NgoPII family restriction endonuclease [Actinobacteria bacterium]|nr:NgoPII family restriction endonuclease [Actinomycetota bacterium]